MAADLHPILEDFLEKLPVENRTLLHEAFREQRLAAGDKLFTTGEQAAEIYLVLEGRLAVHKSTGFGRKTQVVALLGPGALVGEAAIVDGRRRQATVQAIEATRVAHLGREMLLDLETTAPEIVIALLKKLVSVLSLRLEKSSERLALVL